MRSPTQAVAIFGIILLVVVGGVAHAPSWLFLIGATALALISVLNYPVTRQAVGYERSDTARVLLLSSTLNATAISAGAFIAGKLIGWAWGV